MKECIRCNKNLAIRERPAWCGECKREYDREYWAKTKDKRNAQKKINKDITRERNRDFIYSYLLEHHCVDCGEDNPIVLQFDHLTDKTLDLSVMVGRSYSIQTITKEISKCVVRCANCHLKRTAQQLGYWKISRVLVSG